MNIPLNGRIAIVDDKYKEVKPLMDYFSKQRIPFNYYSGRKTELPDDANVNPINLLLLDLNIVETQHNYKSVIGTLHPILISLCPSDSKPYFLVMWSKKLKDFSKHLRNHFRTNTELKKRKPVRFIELDKSDYFNLAADGSYEFEETKIELLKSTLANELNNVTLLKNFLIWENLVHNKTCESINDFSSFYNIDKNWDKNTKSIIFHIAKSITGNNDIIKKSDKEKLHIAFQSINTFLAEKIQDSISISSLGEVSDIKDAIYDANNKKDGIKKPIKEKINTKLHIAIKEFQLDSFEQGNVYKIPNENDMLKKILLREKYDKIARTTILRSKPSLIQIDLTPVCDYSQDKDYVRLVYGIIINAKYSAINIKSDFQRQTPNFLLANKDRFLIIDYRHIKTLSKSEITKRKIKPIFKIKRELCTDIQAQLSNQINRPGISNL